MKASRRLEVLNKRLLGWLPSVRLSGGENNLLINYASLLGGTFSAKGLAFLTVLMLTRYLGTEDFGRYSLVLSFWALMNSLVDIGGAQILAREIAKNPEQTRPYVESAIYLRLLGCLLGLPVAYGLSIALGLTPSLMLLAYLGLFFAFEVYYDMYFTATMQMQQSAKARFFSSWMNLVLIGIAILLRLPLPVILLIALGSPLLKFWLEYQYVPFQWKIAPPDWGLIRKIAVDGWPLWLMGIQYLILSRVDTLLLVMLSPEGKGEAQLGIYSAAFRFSEVMALLITAFVNAVMPLLVAHRHDETKIRFLTSTGVRLVILVLTVVSLAVVWYAPWIAAIYGPGYAAAGDCMRILIWSQALVAVNAVCYQLLIIYNVQGRLPVVVSGTVVMLMNVALNFWLIPQYQAIGSSWATLLSEIGAAVGMLWFVRLYTPNRLLKDLLLIEGLAFIACWPAIYLGGVYGWLSIVLFLLLIYVGRVVRLQDVKQLLREKLP